MIGLFIALFISVQGCLGYLQQVSVYQTHASVKNVDHVGVQEGLIYFSDKFGWDLYSLNDCGDDKQQVVEFLDNQYELMGGNHHSQKPQLVVMVNDDVDGFNKSFVISQETSQFSDKLDAMVSKYGQTITNEIHYIGSNEGVADHFKGFEYRSSDTWSNLINGQMSQAVFAKDMKYVSDKLFINEISSLSHLNLVDFNHDDILVVNLNSLLSLSNKIGKTSTTYKSAKQLLSAMLNSFTQFDITVIKDSSKKSDELSKRSQELELVFNIREGKKESKNKNANCFDSEEDCQVSTSNCNSHGVCSKDSDKCWSCVCSSTYNETLSKTTNWSGFDCSKRDISSSANLLLWSTLAILIMFAAGVKLLMSVGDEPLPGVLDATSTKSS